MTRVFVDRLGRAFVVATDGRRTYWRRVDEAAP